MTYFNRLLLLVHLLLMVGAVGRAQGERLAHERVFGKRQLAEDLDILYASLVNYHPVPFMYTPEAEFRGFYEAQKAALPDSLSEREFYVVARRLIAQLKCGHTAGRIDPAWTKLTTGQDFLLPFEIKRIDGKVYFRNTIEEDFDFAVNDELLSINDSPIEEIWEQVAQLEARDGNTYSFVNEVLPYRFRAYYLLLHGPQSELRLSFRTAAGEVKATTVRPTHKKMKEMPKPALPSNWRLVQENTWSTFAVDSAANVAYLKIRSFGDRKEYKKYYEQVFERLGQHPGAQLVIDLRDNTGGDFRHGNRFLSYLTPQKFEFNFQRPKRKIEKNKHTKMGKWNKLTKLAFSLKPRKHRVEGQRRHTFTYKPRKLRHRGQVHVITNGITFSQAALAAAHLHQYGVVLYGSETGGTETNTNAMAQHQVTLPSTGITVPIPYYQVLSNSTKGSFGYGVRPRYPLSPSLDPTTDAILLSVMDIVRKNP